MYKQEAIDELRNVIAGHLKGQGLELVDLIYHYEGSDLFLRVLADRSCGGINLDECGRLNRELGDILDEKDILKDRYILEVSSPGLDRPLTNKNDFSRCLTRRALFFLKEPVSNKIEWEGEMVKVDEFAVHVEINSGEIITMPLSSIHKAKQIIGINQKGY